MIIRLSVMYLEKFAIYFNGFLLSSTVHATANQSDMVRCCTKADGPMLRATQRHVDVIHCYVSANSQSMRVQHETKSTWFYVAPIEHAKSLRARENEVAVNSVMLLRA